MQRGFTLIELLLVVGLVGLLLIWATPQFLTFNRRQVLQSAANKVVADLKQMQSLAENGVDAATTNKYVWWRSGTNSYKLCKNNCTSGIVLKSKQLDGSLTLSSGTQTEAYFAVPTGNVSNVSGSTSWRICYSGIGSNGEYFDVTVEQGGRIYRSGRGEDCSS